MNVDPCAKRTWDIQLFGLRSLAGPDDQERSPRSILIDRWDRPADLGRSSMAVALGTCPSCGAEKAACCGNLARLVNLTVARTVRIAVLSFCLGAAGTMATGPTA